MNNNNITINQNIANQNNSQIPFFPQPKTPNVEIVISPYGNPIIEGEKNINEIIKNSNDIDLKKKAYVNSEYYNKKIK